MRKVALLFIVAAVFVSIGCIKDGQVQWPWPAPAIPCTVCTDVMPGEPSLICARIPNPCVAYKLLSVAGQAGVVWEAYTVDQAIKFLTANVRPVVEKGVSYEGLQLLLLEQISKFNKQLGATFLILSSEVLIFPDLQVMSPKDQKLALMAVDDFLKKLEMLKLVIQKEKKVTGARALEVTK